MTTNFSRPAALKRYVGYLAVNSTKNMRVISSYPTLDAQRQSIPVAAAGDIFTSCFTERDSLGAPSEGTPSEGAPSENCTFVQAWVGTGPAWPRPAPQTG